MTVFFCLLVTLYFKHNNSYERDAGYKREWNENTLATKKWSRNLQSRSHKEKKNSEMYA
jgi:hypothetical protein